MAPFTRAEVILKFHSATIIPNCMFSALGTELISYCDRSLVAIFLNKKPLKRGVDKYFLN